MFRCTGGATSRMRSARAKHASAFSIVSRPRSVDRAGEHRPGGGHRAHRRARRRRPRRRADSGRRASMRRAPRAALPRVAIARRARLRRPASNNGAMSTENSVQEEAEPDAFAAPPRADRIHAVVPVAGPISGRPCAPKRPAYIDGPRAMAEQRFLVARRRGNVAWPSRPAARSASRNGATRREWRRRPFLSRSGWRHRAARDADRRRGCGRRDPCRLSAPVPPFDRRPRCIGAAMQQDLRPRPFRGQKDQRDHVLQLIAIAGRARTLRRAGAAPKARRQQLIGQPVVDQRSKSGDWFLCAARRACRPRNLAADQFFARKFERGSAVRQALRLGQREPRRANRPAPRRRAALDHAAKPRPCGHVRGARIGMAMHAR